MAPYLAVDKRSPTYDIDAFNALSPMGELNSRNPRSWAHGRSDLVWQDVYYVHYEGFVFYLKFTAGVIYEFTLRLFKEK